MRLLAIKTLPWPSRARSSSVRSRERTSQPASLRLVSARKSSVLLFVRLSLAGLKVQTCSRSQLKLLAEVVVVLACTNGAPNQIMNQLLSKHT